MKVLVISPHYDDEVLGCGGAMIRHVDAGDDVGVVFMTDGSSGDGEPTADARTRSAESSAVAAFLGVRVRATLAEPEGFVDADSVAAEKALIREIRAFRPEIVYLPHAGEAHADHAATCLLVRRASAKAGVSAWASLGIKHKVRQLRHYEIWTPLPSPAVDLLVDISAVTERKSQAMACYPSQLGKRDFSGAVAGLNAYRGLMSGTCASAEAFEVWSALQVE